MRHHTQYTLETTRQVSASIQACKSIYSVISEPEFVKTHLNQSIKLDRQRLFCGQINHTKWFCSTGYEISDDSVEKLFSPMNKSYCSCDGLVLLSGLGGDHNSTWVLWNPSTTSYKKFRCPFYGYEFCLYGLCYDSSIDDYKVVLISNREVNHYRNYEEFVYVVFSSKSNSWTQPRKFTHNPILSETGVNVNRVCHFFVKSSTYIKDNNRGRRQLDLGKTFANISFFDPVNEEFEEMPPPICIGEGDVFGLMVVKGCLGLYCSTPDGNQAKVWVMKEYGEMNSWTKLFVVKRSLRSTFSRNHLRPLCVTKKGEIVMVMDERDIVIYDPKEHTSRNLVTPENMEFSKLFLFVDTSVLPNRN
ncbi:F-box/kelch-repeat protein At3g23880-like [Cornus florida]|uniref:F-box/kelch-repeat protein At3g23880-like n=1 Tax=Cornus florida TaxID=4283 RepID=UPI0028971CDF|nr:F-box/kelch-repeat protein At3g23880-like [Cornus florida]